MPVALLEAEMHQTLTPAKKIQAAANHYTKLCITACLTVSREISHFHAGRATSCMIAQHANQSQQAAMQHAFTPAELQALDGVSHASTDNTTADVKHRALLSRSQQILSTSCARMQLIHVVECSKAAERRLHAALI